MINWFRKNIGVIGIIVIIVLFIGQVAIQIKQASAATQSGAIEKIMKSNLSSVLKDSAVQAIINSESKESEVKLSPLAKRYNTASKLNSLTPPLIVIAVCDTSFTGWSDGASYQIVVRDSKNRFEVIYDRALATSMKVGDTIPEASQ